MLVARLRGTRMFLLAFGLLACSGPDPGVDDVDSLPVDTNAAVDAFLPDQPIVAADLPPPVDLPQPDTQPSTSFVAVTFNTGTSEGMAHDAPPDDGYTSAHAKLSDLWYGDGLAWTKAVNATKAFLAQVDPDVVAFQEVFYSEDCLNIPADAKKDFICETWQPGDPTVALAVLGPNWQVACHPGKPDKCAAVNKRFGTFQGCASDFCLEGLAGYTIDGCGKGARVGRGVIDLVGGGTITLVSVHSSSGIDAETIDCRVKQVKQVFVDLGDGAPAASGARNLIMGDLNTDPGRLGLLDKSADKWTSYVGPNKAFHFITDIGFTALPTYAGMFNIDHVMSDVFTGSCWSAGATPGHPAVVQAVYFDHKPAVCTIKIPAP